MATVTRIRMVVVRSNGENEWEVELGPFERIINVELRGTTACVYIEVGDEER